MNENIKNLWDTALEEFSKQHQFATIMLPEPLREKFARLIVRECVRECKQEWYDTNNDPVLNAETFTSMFGIKICIKQGSLKCISRFKVHFGVEE